MEITAIKLDQLPIFPSQPQIQIFGVNTSSPSPTSPEIIPTSPKERRKKKGSKGPKVIKGPKEIKGPKGIKTYNCKWENDPLLKTWINRHPRDSGKVVCHYCQSVIRAHKNDLLEHTRTRKHMVNFCKNVSVEEYNQFIEMSELRKESTSNRTASSSSSSSPSSSFVADSTTCSSMTPVTTTNDTPISTLPQVVCTTNNSQNHHTTITLITPTTTIMNQNTISHCHIYTTAGGLIPMEIDPITTSVTTSLTPLSAEDFNASNICNVSCSNNGMGNNCVTTTVPTFLNLTASNASSSGGLDDVLGDAEDLWQESEDFISANSPSALVSVILEEQLSPTSNSTSNNSSNCKATLLSNQCETDDSTNVNSINSMILNGISTNIASLNVNLNLLDEATTSVPLSNHENGNIGTLGQGQDTTCSLEHHHSVDHHETILLTTKAGDSLPFTVSDILGAIEEGYFSFSDLCSLAKAAVSQIDRCINGTITTVTHNDPNNLTFCTTTNGNISPSSSATTIAAESLGILSPHGTHIHPLSNANTFSFKKDKSPRKRQQLVLSKVEDL